MFRTLLMLIFLAVLGLCCVSLFMAIGGFSPEWSILFSFLTIISFVLITTAGRIFDWLDKN